MPVLALQSLLLFHRLDLLFSWTDETFTLHTAPQPLAKIPALLDADIHPPLYYLLLHSWLEFPFPGGLLARARAFSVVWVLLATVAVDFFWLRSLGSSVRLRFLILWTVSPCLLLYGRMARSYSMQLFVACLATYAACRMLQTPTSRRWIALYAAAGALLLYTHYAPGLAIPAAVCGVAVWKGLRARSTDLVRPILISHALLLIAYLPWLASAGRALLTWGGKHRGYLATGSLILEQALKLGQWAVTFCFGETLPVWGWWLAALLTPFLAITFWGSWKRVETWAPIAAIAAVGAYLGVSRWVSFPFIPARLLFLYPFFLLLAAKALDQSGKRWRNWVFGALFILWTGGVWAYFSREGFLNKGYNLPMDQMAGLINQESEHGAEDSLIILDTCNSDSAAFTDMLQRAGRIAYVKDSASAEEIRQAAQHSRTIWYWRNTHDVCPGSANRHLEAALTTTFETKQYLFVPYGWVERRFIQWAGWPEQPTHFYQLLEMRRKGE